MRSSLVPRTSEFYDLFTAAGENALEAAHQVDARFRAFPEREVRQAQIKELENKGDDLTRQIIELLKSFTGTLSFVGRCKGTSTIKAKKA